MVASKRKRTAAAAVPKPAPNGLTDPQKNAEVIDAPNALRASPDSDVDERLAPGPVKSEEVPESPLSDVPDAEPTPKKTKKTAPKAAAVKNEKITTTTPVKKEPATKASNNDMGDPEGEGEEEAGEEEIQAALGRPPPVNSDYLPLPWKGRLGYVRFFRATPKKWPLTTPGLPEHIPSLQHAASICLTYLPYCIHSGA